MYTYIHICIQASPSSSSASIVDLLTPQRASCTDNCDLIAEDASGSATHVAATPVAAEDVASTPGIAASANRAAVAAAPQANPSGTCYVDASTLTYVTLHGGVKEATPLTEGTGGFAVAIVRGVEIATEIPNAMLAVRGQKRQQDMRAARPMKKKPAAAPAAPADTGDECCEEHGPQGGKNDDKDCGGDGPSMKNNGPYHLMWYKSGHSIGIRASASSGGKQVLCFGGKAARGILKEDMHSIGLAAIKKLGDNASAAEVKAWCMDQVKLKAAGRPHSERQECECKKPASASTVQA